MRALSSELRQNPKARQGPARVVGRPSVPRVVYAKCTATMVLQFHGIRGKTKHLNYDDEYEIYIVVYVIHQYVASVFVAVIYVLAYKERLFDVMLMI